MRIKYIISLIFLYPTSFVFNSHAQVKTQLTLPNFTPGTYTLKNGNPERCGDGEFVFSKNNDQFLHLGPKHIMGTKTANERFKDNLPGEENCHSESSDNIRYLSKSTIITQNAEDICDGKMKYKLMRQVTIQSNNIKLEVNQQELGEDNRMNPFIYSCEWDLSKRGTDSIKKKKNPKK